MYGSEWLVAGAIIWVICGMIGGAIMSGRGHSFGTGCALGVLFGPLGVLIAAVLAAQASPALTSPTRIIEDQDRRACPHCAEMIMRDAKLCRFCGREVEPIPRAHVVPIPVGGRSYVRCPVCNTKNYASADHCEKCGARFLTPNQKTASAKD